MNQKHTLLLAGLAAALMPVMGFGQEFAPADEDPVSGNCVVSLASDYFKREPCQLTTEDGKVPNRFRLVIEHVSAACSTPPTRGIYTLALITRSNPEDRGKMTHIPVAPQAAVTEQVRMTGAHTVRVYSGSGTGVELLLSTWQSAMPGFTSCDVTFSGILKRITQ